MQPSRSLLATAVSLAVLFAMDPAQAAPVGEVPSLAWGIPFAGLLLSIALLPALAPRFWHRRMGAVAAFWVAAVLLPMAVLRGPAVAAATAWHAILIEYLPFTGLLLALYAAGGGIQLRGGPWGTPAGNTLLLAIGTVLAGVMGTTGAAMVLIHPLLRANAHRARKTHLAVFFIVLVANAGGATTPLGDPPLYVGFLRGVPFGWPFVHLGPLLLLVAGILLTAFFLLDRHLAAGDSAPAAEKLRLRGWGNVALLGVIVATVILQGVWQPGPVRVLGEAIGLERLVALAILAAVAAVSVATTPLAVRQYNDFSWHPMEEVAKLFAAIFITITPLMAILHAGLDGPMAPLLRVTQDGNGNLVPLALFWLTGVLSAFLDNAPTYLVFFELAGGDPVQLTGPLNPSLTAIAAGAVFFGALTYIGNAPNMMVRAIAAHRGVRMPGFFGFMLWAAALLFPVFVIISLIGFR